MKKNQKDILLQDWLDTWYEIYAKPFVKKSTLVSYECYIRKKPVLIFLQSVCVNLILHYQAISSVAKLSFSFFFMIINTSLHIIMPHESILLFFKKNVMVFISFYSQGGVT